MHDLITIQLTDEFRSFQISNIILNPNLWRKYPNRINLDWKRIQFDESQREYIPDSQCGVYSFVVMPGIANHSTCAYLLYVGKTERSFRQRYSEYLYGQKTGKNIEAHKYEMLVKWKDYLWFCYAPITQINIIKQMEDDLIEAYLPPYNKEFPASVRTPMGVLRR